MKKIIFLFFFVSINFCAAQNPYSVGFKLFLDKDWLTSQGFNQLNEILANNNVASLKNTYSTVGHGFIIGRKNKKLSFEIAFGSFSAQALDRATTSNDVAKPSLTGSATKTLIIYKLYEVPRWRITAGAGFSSATLDFTLSDLRPQTNTLSSLINTPSLSPSLVYSTTSLSTKLEFLVGGDYRSKLIREQIGELSVGLRLGYGYQVTRNAPDILWRVKNTQNEIKNFPLIILDNLMLQLNVNVVFNLTSTEKK